MLQSCCFTAALGLLHRLRPSLSCPACLANSIESLDIRLSNVTPLPCLVTDFRLRGSQCSSSVMHVTYEYSINWTRPRIHSEIDVRIGEKDHSIFESETGFIENLNRDSIIEHSLIILSIHNNQQVILSVHSTSVNSS